MVELAKGEMLELACCVRWHRQQEARYGKGRKKRDGRGSAWREMVQVASRESV